MPYNTKELLTDKNGSFIPQLFNPAADEYRPTTGIDLGSNRYALDMLPWGKTSGGLYVPIRVTDEGAQEVALNGSIVELLPRQVRTEPSDFVNHAVPAWAKGAIYHLVVYGITGTFAADQGVRLQVYAKGVYAAQTGAFYNVFTARIKIVGGVSVMIYPGIEDNSTADPALAVMKLDCPVIPIMQYYVSITGTFEAGQGIDCSLHVQYLP